MRIVIILVVLLILAGGGTFAAATLVPGMVPAPIRDLLGVVYVEPEPDPNYRPENTTLIEIDPLTIPIFENGDVDRFLIIHVLLEVEVGEKQAHVQSKMIHIIDMFITYTHALASLKIEPGIGDRQFLKERLLAKLDETIGKGYVIDILFQNLFERPLG
ncbi:MAG: hypothetical protein HQ481_12800 [Alphaproteobacteria bacterium]|nr:hypothetical protein [Alphaproteobacteria bacterium]